MTEVSIFAINIIILIIVAISFYKKTSKDLKAFFWPLLFLKVSIGVSYGYLYLYYYNSGDTFDYFNQSTKIALLTKENVSEYLEFLFTNKHLEIFKISYSPVYQSRAFWMTKAISPLLILTNNNYWLVSCYLSLFSFCGIFYLAETLVGFYQKERYYLIFSFFLLPSFAFWSSGLSKESLSIGCLCYLVAVIYTVYYSSKLNFLHFIFVPIAIWILWKIRFFYLITLALTVGPLLFFQLVKVKLGWNTKKAFFVTSISTILLLLVLSQLEYALHLDKFLETLLYSNKTQFNNNPSNAIIYYRLNPDFISLILNSPIALVSGLFRPSLLDSKALLMSIVGFENLLLLILTVTRIKNLRYNSLETAMWCYIVVLALFLAFSSPNFGSLTRYKVGFLPFFLFLLLKEHPILLRLEMFLKNLKNP